MLASVVGLAVFVVLEAEDGDDDGSLATASDELTVDGLLSVLLTEDDLPSAFSEESRGEPEDDELDSFVDQYEGLPAACEEALSHLEERGAARAEDMRVEAEFTRSSDEAFVLHTMSPVRTEDVTMDELLEAYDRCDEPMDVTHEDAGDRTLRFEAERLDGLGEDAVALAYFEEGVGLPGTLELYEVSVARGGVYSTVTMGGLDADTGESQGADRDLVRDLAGDVDAKIQQATADG